MAVSPRFSLLENPIIGVGISWKSTNSCLTLLKCTVLGTKVVLKQVWLRTGRKEVV